MSKTIGFDRIGNIEAHLIHLARTLGPLGLPEPGEVTSELIADHKPVGLDPESVIVGLELAMVALQEAATRTYAVSEDLTIESVEDYAFQRGTQVAAHAITGLTAPTLHAAIAHFTEEAAVKKAFDALVDTAK